jgi:hypothetical protein
MDMMNDDTFVDETEIELSFKECLRFELSDDAYLETYKDSDTYFLYYVTDKGEEKTLEIVYSDDFELSNNIVTITNEYLKEINKVKLNYTKEKNNG